MKKKITQSAIHFKEIFDTLNEACKTSGESVVEYSDVEYYTQQIQNILNCNKYHAMDLALQLYRLSQIKP